MPDQNRGAPDWKSVSDPSALDLPPGTTVLVASSGPPTQHGLGLRALCRNGAAADTGLAVTTVTGTEESVHAYDAFCSRTPCPSLRIVDTTANHPSGRHSYKERPVVLVPGASDLERIALALSELTDHQQTTEGDRHLLVDSLTPILDLTATTSVCRMVDRIDGIRSGNGHCLFGVDYTAHSTETMAAVTNHVDGILWVTHGDGTIDLEYRPTRGRHLTTPVEAAVDD